MDKPSLPKILYVDDEVINLELFKLIYEGDYNILLASSGEVGLDTLRQDPAIDLIISDMRMPGMNGMEFIGQVREMGLAIPGIILSGYQKTDEIQKAIDNGTISGYEMKPFDKVRFKQLMNSTLCQES